MEIQVSPNGRRAKAERQIIEVWWIFRKSPRDPSDTEWRIVAITAVFDEFGEDIFTADELARIRDAVMHRMTVRMPEKVLEDRSED